MRGLLGFERFDVALGAAVIALLCACSPTQRDAEDHSEHPESASTQRSTNSAFGPLELIEFPAAPGSLAPNLTVTPAGDFIATWLERKDPGVQLRSSKLRAGTWIENELIIESSAMFANWADLPGLVETYSGDRLAYWLGMLGEGTYAYGIELSTQSPEEDGWHPRGLVHPDDSSPTEHGFVSSVLLAGSRAQLFWLDGRAMEADQPMQLRTTTVDLGGSATGVVGSSSILDPRVCECCSTDAAKTEDGPIVAYRDRLPDEVRDIWIVRGVEHTKADGVSEIRWSEPQAVSRDGWQIHGCPVNGPAVAASERDVAIAWYTAADNHPMVKVAFSSDAGQSFSAPVVIDDQQPLGRVDLVLDSGKALISWIAALGTDRAEVRVARVTPRGEILETRSIAPTSLDRIAGVPRMVGNERQLLLSWIEEGTIRSGVLLATNRESRP